MILMYPITRIIGVIAISYAAVVSAMVALIWMFAEEPTLWKSISIALSGGTVLQFALFGAAHQGWRKVWSFCPVLNAALFPDLNGEWKIKIDWQGPDRSGSVNAAAVIKQSLIKFSMEVAAPDSDSETYAAIPKKDSQSGRTIIYYMYRVVPRNTGQRHRGAYDGAAVLKCSNAGLNEIGGNYFTSNHTSGYFHLTR